MFRDQAQSGGRGAGRAWPVWARVLASMALLAHMAAILAAAVSAPPSSELQRGLARGFERYYELTDQGYGYRYYTEPPPTALIRARLRFADGRPEQVVQLPDRARRPRLRYQRHLALAYHLFEDFNAARSAPGGPVPSRWARSYARHLCRTHPGCSGVTLALVMHLIPDLRVIREAASRPGATPVDVDDERFFTVPERIGDYPCADF
ncbi:MAG TPA: hypothetical protein VF590_09860 [Isosphaeraceae bacterium]